MDSKTNYSLNLKILSIDDNANSKLNPLALSSFIYSPESKSSILDFNTIPKDPNFGNQFNEIMNKFKSSNLTYGASLDPFIKPQSLNI